MGSSLRIGWLALVAALAVALCGAGAALAAPTPAAAPPATTTTATGATGPTGPAGPAVPARPARPRLRTLSDFADDVTRWAHTAQPGARVRRQPSAQSRTVARLHLLTEDGLPEVYELLAERPDAHGAMWVHIAVPMRPNGVTGWVPRDDLARFHVVRTMLVVNTERHRITLLRSGRRIFTAPVGVGKPSTPTPHGRFWIREKFPVGPQYPVYGPFALGTSDYSNVETDWPGGGIIGIHGTDQPALVPGRPSHGCIRLHNNDVRRLYPLIPVGTPLIVE